MPIWRRGYCDLAMAKLMKYEELQLVEQRTENPRVGGSNPPRAPFLKNLAM